MVSKPNRTPRAFVFVLSLFVFLGVAGATRLNADCGLMPLGPIQEGNVTCGLKDSVSACPAGDSVAAGHAARLRINVYYFDANCNPKVGVPPESIWVTIPSTLGGLKVNDEGAKIFADDSTDGAGHARITIPSFSGNGTVIVALKVSGVSQGTKSSLVRTTDTNGDGRSDAADLNCYLCWADINYSGTINNQDLSIIASHSSPKHWHRNTLFGTLVRRTTTCGTCGNGAFNTLGDDWCWSTNGKMLAVTIYGTNYNCSVELMPTDPAVGNGTIPFSMPSGSLHDYSPQWSPFGTRIYWNRSDHFMMYKGIAGQSPDTSTITIGITSDLNYLTESSLSPDGATLAFAGFHDGEFPSIYTVPTTGGSPHRVTSDAAVNDQFPQWSPDGSVLLFQRGNGIAAHLYEIEATASGGTPRAVDAGDIGSNPFYHPDGSVFVFAKGSSSLVTVTLDSTLSSAAGAVTNYPEYVNPSYAEPKMSPDGTRVGMRAVPPSAPSELAQIWVARRNMSLPPQFTQVASQGIVDSTVTVSLNVKVGLQSSIMVNATDSESDQLTYGAYFLQPGMTFNPSTRTLTWTPPGPVGQTYVVKFFVRTASGGADAVLVALTTVPALGPNSVRPSELRYDSKVWPNPSRSEFAFQTAPEDGATAHLSVFDVEGRRIATLSGPAGSTLVWKGLTLAGRQAREGVYLYHLETPHMHHDGKFILVR